ncbi:MAG: two pore domain potassium channel family protein, partial [Flavobacteriaceae bacterium]|nr:two pore domain potassium channel family protein [Flavobacteriaceae bacterium]
MNYFIFILGVILLIITATDLINTSLSVRGAGFITKRLSKTIWTLLLAIHKKTGAGKLLEMGGAFILVSILINWLLLIWISASLLFISQPDSLINIESNSPTTIISKIFYTGYTLSTLGLGDIEPYGPFWEILTAILSFTGLILISIAITYLIPVVSAEIIKRRISVYITTLGCSVEDILMNYWNGKNFKELEQPFVSLT